MKLEHVLLTHLCQNESYARKVLPFLRPEYFSDACDSFLFSKITSFITKYDSLPSQDALSIEAQSAKGLTQDQFNILNEFIGKIRNPLEPVSLQWLLDTTEKFCQDRAIYNAIMNSISILDGKSTQTKDHLPELLKDALSVSFDEHVGHDFLEDSEQRFDFYTRKEEKIAFDLELMNKITRGGLSRKSLNILLAGTAVGKSLAMCHMAAANLTAGKNVLYITLEMSEEKIAERIDANLLNFGTDELATLPRETYVRKIARLRSKTVGKLIIKEYPTATAHVGHFRHLLNELNLKRNFVPDIIYVDYLNICTSSRIRPGSNVNTYSFVKSIAEELRGLAVEKNVPLVSATQTNRTGYSNSDPTLSDTSESFGLPATADFMVALVSSEELEEQGQIMVKQLKNRYNDPSYYRKFVVGVDRAKMRLYDVDEEEQTLSDSPVMDNTGYGERRHEEETMKWSTKKMGRKDFSNLKT